VKKHRSIPHIEGDAEGLNKNGGVEGGGAISTVDIRNSDASILRPVKHSFFKYFSIFTAPK